MFTGIVEEKGRLLKVISGSSSGSIEVAAERVLEGSRIGDSIAVNGVCLTVTALKPRSFTADVMPETLRRTNLGEQRIGAEVNLERAMAAGGRFGGHIVSGHIDGTGTVEELKAEGNAVWVSIQAAPEILALIVEKGSICIDGISLTVAYVDSRIFRVSIIPHTGAETTLLKRKPGDRVNLENDIVGKYIARLMQPYASDGQKYSQSAQKAGATKMAGSTGSIGTNGAAVGIAGFSSAYAGGTAGSTNKSTASSSGLTMEMLMQAGI